MYTYRFFNKQKLLIVKHIFKRLLHLYHVDKDTFLIVLKEE